MNTASPLAGSSVGIQSRVPAEEYFSLPAMSISRLKEMRRSPLHYLYRLDNPKESAPMSLGTAAHCAVLEPERFTRQFAVWERRTEAGASAPRRGQYWDAFCAENAGKTFITDDERAIALAIQKAVRGHAAALRYLEHGDPEVTLQWMIGNRECRGRVDWLTHLERPTLVGLKTSRDCRHFAFGKQAAQLGYHLQWAFYSDGYFAIKGANPDVVEIEVENTPPHAVAVYRITDDILAQGREEYETLLERLAECERTGHFPGPNEDEEDLTLPSWVYQAEDDLSELGLEKAT